MFGSLLVLAAWFGPGTSLLSPEYLHLWLIGWFGLVPLISGIAAFCPVYAVIGCGHKPSDKKQKSEDTEKTAV